MFPRNSASRMNSGLIPAGQSGDIQQLPEVADADAEAVGEYSKRVTRLRLMPSKASRTRKLPIFSEVTTREVPGDDLRTEHQNEDEHAA